MHVSLFGTVLSISDNIMHSQGLISVFLKNTSRDQLFQKAYSSLLPECIAFNQSALRHFLPKCTAPSRVDYGSEEGLMVVMFCADLHEKKCEEDLA